jgi:predicted lactoylglutathione lyase
MARMIFVNLPVKDLEASKRFYGELGFGFDERFSDDTAACIVIDDSIFAMLLTEEKFKSFINGEIADATSTTEVLNALSADSREEVDQLADKALASGGSEWRPEMDMGFMYSRSFQDPDGHVWELVHMDMAAAEDAQATAGQQA